MYACMYARMCKCIRFYHNFVGSEVSFEITAYEVNEREERVELALQLSEILPSEFDAILRLIVIDDNTTGSLQCMDLCIYM